MRIASVIRTLALGLTGAIMTMPAYAETITLTGWFSCKKCVADRVAKGDVRPSNPVCAKQCIEGGDDAVFLSEQGKELLKVKNYASATEDLGYHLEVRGVVDSTQRTISIDSVKRLSVDGASCARPRANKTK